MTKQNGNPNNDDFIRQGSSYNITCSETIPRFDAASDLAIAATGVVQSVGIPLQVGDLVTNLTFVTGATAAGTPTAGFVALYSPAGVLLGQSADFGSTARAANTAYSIALATPVLITVAGMYYAAISFTATTVPTLRGASVLNAVVAGAVTSTMKILSQSHGSAVGATAPATIATPTTTFAIPYMVAT
jgi:hypothetical protein